MIKPYYADNDITLYCGASENVLPIITESVDVVLTDPPYGINGSTGKINISRGKGEYSEQFEDTPIYIKNVCVKIITMCIDKYGSVVLTPGNKNFTLYPQPDSFGCFYQPASIGLQKWGNADSQPIFYYGKNPTKKNMGTPLSFTMTERPEESEHPCPKPIKTWMKLMKSISIEGQTILDPFSGSGTTLIAAKLLKRKAIGIEISEKYCEMIVNRLNKPMPLFEDVKPTDLFKQ